jgi:N5-(cytidine 5'-diphosphoramidyl)-L-glutamine hydrolase
VAVIAVTQRSCPPDSFGEVREGLDVRWRSFLAACGLTAMPVPNDPAMALELVDTARPHGILLTGGGDLLAYGGADAGREATERALLGLALDKRLPVHGVCRGMQFLLDSTGVPLHRVDGHVATAHRLDGRSRVVNSFHMLGASFVTRHWQVTATCGGMVEAVAHRQAPLTATMWHPERETSPHPEDVMLFRALFLVAG